MAEFFKKTYRYRFISIVAHLFSHWTEHLWRTKWQLYLVNFFQVIFDVMFCHLAGYDEINLIIKEKQCRTKYWQEQRDCAPAGRQVKRIQGILLYFYYLSPF
jgi:hypothetical protein